MPPDTGLERDRVTLGVAEKQTAKARQALQCSAETAGFFGQEKERLVMPIETPTKSVDEVVQLGVEHPPAVKPGGSGDTPSNLHPFIKGLLDTLPAPEFNRPGAKRKQWLRAAEDIFELLYIGDNANQNLTH